jgi:NDP-sugar pyrophosphorylase family protein
LGSGIQFVVEPGYAHSNYWLNAIICPDLASREAILRETNTAGVMTRPIWKLMHRLPMFEGALQGDLSQSEFIEAHLVNLPSTPIEQYFGDGSALGVKITYVHEESPLGTGGALGLLPKDLPKDLPLIIMNGDVLTKVDFQRLLAFHTEHQADATMCVREYDYQIPYGVINGEGNKITSMIEKPVQRFFVNAGIYVVSPRVIHSVPENHHIDMPTLLEQHMKERENILMFPIHEYWLDIGRMDDFNRAQADIHTLGILQ